MKLKYIVIIIILTIVFLICGCTFLNQGLEGKWHNTMSSGNIFTLSGYMFVNSLGNDITVNSDNTVKNNDIYLDGTWSKTGENTYVFTPAKGTQLASYGNAQMSLKDGRLWFEWSGGNNDIYVGSAVYERA